jgi:hypothetical protein
MGNLLKIINIELFQFLFLICCQFSFSIVLAFNQRFSPIQKIIKPLLIISNLASK